jgi:hypothetical protein
VAAAKLLPEDDLFGRIDAVEPICGNLHGDGFLM